MQHRELHWEGKNHPNFPTPWGSLFTRTQISFCPFPSHGWPSRRRRKLGRMGCQLQYLPWAPVAGSQSKGTPVQPLIWAELPASHKKAALKPGHYVQEITAHWHFTSMPPLFFFSKNPGTFPLCEDKKTSSYILHILYLFICWCLESLGYLIPYLKFSAVI